MQQKMVSKPLRTIILKKYEKSINNLYGSSSLHVPTLSFGSVSGESGLVSIFIVWR